jgi:hypothetical protein
VTVESIAPNVSEARAYNHRVWRVIILGTIALGFSCGSRHESTPRDRQGAPASRSAPRDAESAIDGTRAIASTVSLDAAEQQTPITPATAAPPRPHDGGIARSSAGMRCAVRVTAKGIYVDGDPRSRSEAIATCKRTAGALVALEDNAPAEVWKALQAGLRREGVPILMRGTVDDRECLNNRFAKGCN